MGDEVAFIVVEAVVPVMNILGEVHLLSGPEGSLSFLVHLPDLERDALVWERTRPKFNTPRGTE